MNESPQINGTVYTPTDNFTNFHPFTLCWTYRPSFRAQKGPEEAKNQLFSQKMGDQGRLFGLGMI